MIQCVITLSLSSPLFQELTNQLIELERHLNTLELNKFGENDGIQMSQRTFPGRYGPSRYGNYNKYLLFVTHTNILFILV